MSSSTGSRESIHAPMSLTHVATLGPWMRVRAMDTLRMGGVKAWYSRVGPEVSEYRVEEVPGVTSFSVEYLGKVSHNPIVSVSCCWGCRRYCCRGSLRRSWSSGSSRSSRSARSARPSRSSRGWCVSAHGVV